jgi:signal transduction histidine kinase
MRFEQLETLFRSLRFRLSAWNTAAVLLIVAVTLLAVREAARLTLIRENDLLLNDDTAEVALAVEGFYPDMNQIVREMERKAQGHADRSLFVQLFDAEGKLVAASGTPPNLRRIPPPDVALSPAMRTEAGHRMAHRVISKPGLPRFTVRVGASLSMIRNDVARLTRLMAAAGIAILFIAPLSGYFLAGRATRPLGRIITTAARLRPSRMEERLPIRGTQDELDQLSTTINRFLDLLRDYLERNREFVANAAHELRSPLAAIQSSVEVTLNSPRTVDEYQDMLEEVADECAQLRVLVNQLLLLAETDSAQLPAETRPVAFELLLARSFDMFRGAAEERGVRLTADVRDQVAVHGHAERLRQVVNNLIDNALKFTPRGGQVTASLARDPVRDELELRVTDTGPGISPDDMPHVFERFYRGDKSRHREPMAHGNGLGLSICHSIVSAHGGTILVESNRPTGASIVVRLPLAVSKELKAAQVRSS